MLQTHHMGTWKVAQVQGYPTILLNWSHDEHRQKFARSVGAHKIIKIQRKCMNLLTAPFFQLAISYMHQIFVCRIFLNHLSGRFNIASKPRMNNQFRKWNSGKQLFRIRCSKTFSLPTWRNSKFCNISPPLDSEQIGYISNFR